MRELEVDLGARRYPIRIGAGLLDAGTDWEKLLPGRHVLIVSDRNVAPLYLARVEKALAGKTVGTLILPAGEQEKTLQRFGEAIDALAALGASRDATVVALGGGVVGDLAGFAAASWMRGVRFVQLPTTMLAMVDSSVGGKTAVDIPAGKNLVGAFHQPSAVIADTSTLVTLPLRELRAGLAEVVKYGAIGDATFFAWLEAHADALLARDGGGDARAPAGRRIDVQPAAAGLDSVAHPHQAVRGLRHCRRVEARAVVDHRDFNVVDVVLQRDRDAGGLCVLADVRQ